MIFATAIAIVGTIVGPPPSSYAEISPTDVVGKKKFIVITNMEPKNRLLFQLMSKKFQPDQIAFVGTTLLNSRHKAILARALLDHYGLSSVPVIQGSGGEPYEYEVFGSAFEQSEHADEFAKLSDEDLKNFDLLRPGKLKLRYGDVTLIIELSNYLQANYATGNRRNIDIILLASPDDLLEAFRSGLGPAIQSIGTIHMPSGWTEILNPQSMKIERRSTYHWNMGFHATNLFFNNVRKGLFPVHVRIYSPQALPQRIQNQSDRLLANALPLLGAAEPSFVTATQTINVKLNLKDLDYNRGFLVELSRSRNNHVELVEKINCDGLLSHPSVPAHRR